MDFVENTVVLHGDGRHCLPLSASGRLGVADSPLTSAEPLLFGFVSQQRGWQGHVWLGSTTRPCRPLLRLNTKVSDHFFKWGGFPSIPLPLFLGLPEVLSVKTVL